MFTLRYTPGIDVRFPARPARPKSRRYADGPSRLRRAVQIGRDILLAGWAIGVLAFELAIACALV